MAKVLIVDDDKEISSLISLILKKENIDKLEKALTVREREIWEYLKSIKDYSKIVKIYDILVKVII